MNTVYRSILVWFCFLALAFVNGAFREIVMIKFLGIAQPLASQLSCLTGISLWTALLIFVWKRLQVKKLTEAIAIGMGWLFATILFETFILNRKMTASEILHTYDVTRGEYWGLVLLWIGLMPLAAYAIVEAKRFKAN